VCGNSHVEIVSRATHARLNSAYPNQRLAWGGLKSLPARAHREQGRARQVPLDGPLLWATCGTRRFEPDHHLNRALFVAEAADQSTQLRCRIMKGFGLTRERRPALTIDTPGFPLPSEWFRAWQSVWRLAPSNLVEPILPGWTFNINSNNSSAPETEA